MLHREQNITEEAVRRSLVWHTLAIRSAPARGYNAASYYSTRAVEADAAKELDIALVEAVEALRLDHPMWGRAIMQNEAQ